MIEALVCVNVIFLMACKRVYLPKGWIWFTLFVGWALISGPVGKTGSLYDGFLYGRYTLYAFGLYILAWNHPFTANQLKTLRRIIALGFVLQVCASVGTSVFLGIRTEWRVGTMSVGGGERAAIFPLLGLGYAMGWYLYVKRSSWIFLIALSFGLVGYASDKRAIYVMFPLFVFLNGLLYWVLRQQRRPKLFRVGQCVVGGALIGIWGVGAIYGMQHSTGFEDVLSKSSGISEAASETVRYITQSELSNSGKSSGRVSSTLVVFENLAAEGMPHALTGWGPGTFQTSTGNALGGGFAPLGIAYGIVGWVHVTIAVGLFGALFYFGAYSSVLVQVYRVTRATRLSPEGAAIAFGTVSGCVALLYAYLFYGSTFIFSGWFTFPLVFFAGIICSPSRFYQDRTLRGITAHGQRVWVNRPKCED